MERKLRTSQSSGHMCTYCTFILCTTFPKSFHFDFCMGSSDNSYSDYVCIYLFICIFLFSSRYIYRTYSVVVNIEFQFICVIRYIVFLILGIGIKAILMGLWLAVSEEHMPVNYLPNVIPYSPPLCWILVPLRLVR